MRVSAAVNFGQERFLASYASALKTLHITEGEHLKGLAG